jgi:hypothetical protein
MTPYRSLITLLVVASASAASGAASDSPQPGAGAATPSTAALPAPKPPADLRQLMRGIFFPAANVVFAGQQDPEALPRPEDPSVSPNPLTSTYGGWQAVQNASLALAEASSLLVLPGRMCSSGHPAPMQRADWQKYVRQLRSAALVSYKAAQTKNIDAMLDASDTLTQACSACHEVYRDKDKKGGDKNRCLP